MVVRVVNWGDGAGLVGFGKRRLQKSLYSRGSRDSEVLEILQSPQTLQNKGKSDHFSSRDFRESRGFRDSRDSSIEKTPFRNLFFRS